ncbi:phosphoesterase [Candidatus Woesearchaeota archaeon CG10_big_fil_rev_8_21_14_0_10_30_7]|nr:MAG: phosphoesterase [Candidatus Woesearchaeota archaeon CG10_big_fil_rev_8_21_14_0_10_30_7]
MEINKGILIKDLALYLKKHETLIIGDLHLGYEGYLEKKGVLIPRFQLKDIIRKLKKLLKLKIKRVILNGDIKHEFGKILKQEWTDITKLFDLLNNYEVIVIKGNHDVILHPITDRKNIGIVKEYQLDDVLIIHGDSEPKIDKTIKTIIMGHEHPAISFKETGRVEKYKCFLKGIYKKKTLIVQPSFNPLIEGSDILKERFLSPLFKNITNCEIWVIDREKVLNFGKLNKLKRKLH